MSGPLDLVALLDLERLDEDRFLGANPLTGPERLFGGQVLSQALRAACATVEVSRPPHSLHAYFIRAGRLEEPITFEVVRTRDGWLFGTRQVTAVQDGKPILILSGSFHVAEDGIDWQLPAPSLGEVEDYPVVEFGHLLVRLRDPLSGHRHTGAVPGGPAHLGVRARQQLPDDPILHACVLASDSGYRRGAERPGPDEGPPFAGASLDHALWLHRPHRADEWLLMHTAAVSNGAALGLAVGAIHATDGTPVASVAQEVLLRSLNFAPDVGAVHRPDTVALLYIADPCRRCPHIDRSGS